MKSINRSYFYTFNRKFLIERNWGFKENSRVFLPPNYDTHPHDSSISLTIRITIISNLDDC
ncbi:hypothetical protein KFK09_005226 [Dendrobium nobile]|uniref:Uncharacterized protein n=1 Tax=Dendrobium nobile TaxID=94219 RepID=A0A8T3BXV4_DENNO|nr:hypothetical protein KFK09_005226 [Dendrobium nobile]